MLNVYKGKTWKKPIQVDDLGCHLFKNPPYMSERPHCSCPSPRQQKKRPTCRLLGTEHMGMQYVPSGTLT